MTSEATLKDTKEFFEYRSYFGLEPDNVIFFKQHLLPCLSFEGQLLLADKGKDLWSVKAFLGVPAESVLTSTYCDNRILSDL